MPLSSAAVDLEQLIATCTERGIRFRTQAGQLRTVAPAGAIDADLEGRIRSLKTELIDALRLPQLRALRAARHAGIADVPLCAVLRLADADPARLSSSLDAVVAAHPALRLACDPAFVSRILAQCHVALGRTDLSVLPEAQREAALDEACQQFGRAPFDLARGEMLRALLVNNGTAGHFLLLAVHPLAADEESLDVLVEQLLTAPAGVHGDDAQAVPGGQGEVDEAWWREALRTLPEYHSLPLDMPRSRQRKGSAQRFAQRLDRQLSQQLQALSQRHGTTLFCVLHTALAVLLARWSGSDEVALGAAVSMRAPGSQVVGPLRQTVALPCRLDETTTFGQLLSAQQAAHDAVLAHLPAPPMPCQLRFGLRRAPRRHWAGAERLEAPVVRTAFDLDIVAEQDEDGLSLAWTFADDVFHGATVRNMMTSFTRLLAGLTTDEPARCLLDLVLLTQRDEERIAAWNRTSHDYPRDACVHELVARQAAHTPSATALVAEARTLTYAQLDSKANALAHRLLAAGVQPGEPVPVMMHSGLEVPVSYLAVMKAGAVFAPVDVNWPEQRQAAVLDAMAPRLVLTMPETLDSTLAPALPRLTVDLDQLVPAAAPQRRYRATDPIYIVHTSGSTGAPKGAINLHRGIVNRLSFMDRYFGTDARDVVLQTTHHCFDSAIWQFFWPLTRGGTCVIPPYARHFELGNIVDLIFRHEVTLTDFTPALLMLFAEHLEQLPATARGGCRLRDLIAGGEELTLPVVRKFHAVLPQVRLHNFYGPSETSIGVLCCEITAGDVPRTIPIGRPIDNVTTAIVDGRLRQVPVGMPGELLLGGDCVGAGYLHNEAETARRFLRLPLPQFHDGPSYRTGDLVRQRDDGNIEFLGRIDTQVKIRGFRIEISEVQARLEMQPGVRQAYVRAEGSGAARELAAFVVPDALTPAPQHLVGQLQAALQRELPDYMVPNAFVLLEALPLLPNGKVDARRLTGERITPQAQPAFTAPVTETEQALAGIWAELFSVERVSLHDDFFALGGHSLLATQFVARARRQLQVEIPLRAVFDHPRLDALSRWFDQHRMAG